MRRLVLMLAFVIAIVAAPFVSSAAGPSYCVGAGVTVYGKRIRVLPQTCVPCSAKVCETLPPCVPLLCGGAAASQTAEGDGR